MKEEKKLPTIRSAENLLKIPSNHRDEPTSSGEGEYLTSLKRNKSVHRVKKSGMGDKTSSKWNHSKPIMTVKRNGKPLPTERTHHDSHNEYRLTQRCKERERKTNRKDERDKYGEKEIKIKTESCTSIKVVYKKKR